MQSLNTALTVAVAGAIALAAAAASAGELAGGVWRPLDCAKPSPPAVDRTDAQSLNASIVRYNAYVAEVERYDACVRAEAERDLQAIQDGYQAAQAEAHGEADAARPRGTQAAQ